ncbi:hypothetical protein ABEB36_002373 [Hypothenemus hampei]|uniref:Beta-glucosidase n=1 Tax=Hypothenemus hampei TaxID=57062 RepID=A0ABD1F5I5_HYPHA
MFKFLASSAILLISGISAVKDVPKDFAFGAGTSAFQIEGAWKDDGKGVSIWDTFLHNKNAKENGDIACDSYHKWKEDVANVKALGLEFYRFSIAWTRIMPNGTLNQINKKGIEYYMNLIKGLKDEGIEPMVTIYHWDMPEYIQQLGGFLNPQFVDYFADFARLLFQQFAPYVKYWFTFNEPSMVCVGGYELGSLAPGLQLHGEGVYQCSYVLLKAHARAYRIYEQEFKAKYNGQVGLVINFDWAEPVTKSAQDLEAQRRHIEFALGWWANPIFLGNWPPLMIDRIANRSKMEGFVKSRLPAFTSEEIKDINGTHDFFALNTYSVSQVKYEPEPAIGQPSYNSDKGVDLVLNDSYYYPQGLRTSVNYINKKYQPKAIMITENGKLTSDGLDDQDRINTIRDFINNLVDAKVKDNVNITAYSLWSLMDNFEWGSYEKKFGVIRVDFDSPNRTRTWKKSAKWYQNMIVTRKLDI